MGNVKLLDCTLRDGGYINDWRFGESAVRDITDKLTESRMEYVEIGFLKDEGDIPGRTIFPTLDKVGEYTHGAINGNVTYCAMCEALNPLPIDKIAENDGSSVDVIRVIVWKRLLDKGFEYCKGIVDRGYKLCVQPNRVDQYPEEEYVEMVHMFNELNPLAIYVVDSFGLLNSRQLLEYAKIADREMKEGIALGYHGHNNMQQTFETAQTFLKYGFDRDIMLDGSVYGIGRGAGNLCTELIADYLNKEYDKLYDIRKLLEINDRYIQDIYQIEKWGYRPGYYLTARHKCNPMYGLYYEGELGLKSADIDRLLSTLTGDDLFMFNKDKARELAIKMGVIAE